MSRPWARKSALSPAYLRIIRFSWSSMVVRYLFKREIGGYKTVYRTPKVASWSGLWSCERSFQIVLPVLQTTLPADLFIIVQELGRRLIPIEELLDDEEALKGLLSRF